MPAGKHFNNHRYSFLQNLLLSKVAALYGRGNCIFKPVVKNSQKFEDSVNFILRFFCEVRYLSEKDLGLLEFPKCLKEIPTFKT